MMSYKKNYFPKVPKGKKKKKTIKQMKNKLAFDTIFNIALIIALIVVIVLMFIVK